MSEELKCPRCNNTDQSSFIAVEWLGTDRTCYFKCNNCGYKMLRFTISETKKLFKRSRKLCEEMDKLSKERSN